MDDKTLIARRVALELCPGNLVNLGIGLPTLVAAMVPRDAGIFFQSENGIIGMQAVAEEGLEADDLTDAGGNPISALPGSATFDSAMSFGFIRGGHLDVTRYEISGPLPGLVFPANCLEGGKGVCREEEAFCSRTDRRGVEAGGAGDADSGPHPPLRDLRGNLLSVEEAVFGDGVGPGS